MTDFAKTRAAFALPESVIYLDGNSLGPLSRHAVDRVTALMREEWGNQLIRGWNDAGWMLQPRQVGDRIARLIGAPTGSVVMGDTLSIKVYQALAAAIDLRPGRHVVLSDTGNFPTDLYMAEGLLASLGGAYELRVVDPADVMAAIDENVAAVMLTEVDYRTGRLHDMRAITARAHAAGVIAIWDLAHSAGAIPIDLTGAKADFAVGCTYKYLNGGPGAPAFIYVAPHHQVAARPALSGWMGHAEPFAFEANYRAGAGIERMRVGTPPILALAALDAALDVWDEVAIEDVRRRSLEMSDLFIAEVGARCPELELASPREGALRGSQVSFRHPDGYAIMQALIARNVIGDFRAPDILRFGLTPLYLGPDEIRRAVRILEEIMTTRAWDDPRFRARSLVT
jgi:kynureninase